VGFDQHPKSVFVTLAGRPEQSVSGTVLPRFDLHRGTIRAEAVDLQRGDGLVFLTYEFVRDAQRAPDAAGALVWGAASGRGRTIDALAATFEGLAARGALRLENPRLAAEHFNWLVMSTPLNRVMLCNLPGRGDDQVGIGAGEGVGDHEHVAVRP
jgi:hypothetical protein